MISCASCRKNYSSDINPRTICVKESLNMNDLRTRSTSVVYQRRHIYREIALD